MPAAFSTLQQFVNAIAAAFYNAGGRHAVICPGSRNAPLTVAFSRHPGITCYSIPDERSAGFMALGVAQQTQQPAAVICTSGTAVLNLYPAICEAYYQQIPVVAITADRPPELIDQWDGQAIHQQQIFEKHILDQYSLPVFNEDPDPQGTILRITSLIISSGQQQMPVHINIPFREPFYPGPDEEYSYPQSAWPDEEGTLLPAHVSSFDTSDMGLLYDAAQKSRKVMLVLGSGTCHRTETTALSRFVEKYTPVVLADVLANDGKADKITSYDVLLRNTSLHKELAPELLITMGGPVVSKSLKTFLKSNKPRLHFHVQRTGHVGDPFQTLTHVLRQTPEKVFALWPGSSETYRVYRDVWEKHTLALHTAERMRIAATEPLTQLLAVQKILQALPSRSMLQLSSSMPVRYATILGVRADYKTFCNRGTSGIDGSSSTAVGASWCFNGITTLVTGDIAFFYDINAFWHAHLHNRLRVIVLNNKGGGIFRLIDGPSALKELDPYFETPHQRSAARVAMDFGFDYFTASDTASLEEVLSHFFSGKNRHALLEINTNPDTDTRVYKAFIGATQ